MSEAVGLMFLTRKDGNPVVIVKAAVVSWCEDHDDDVPLVRKSGLTRINMLDGHFQIVQEMPQQIATLWEAT
jgi:hypothetical protein